MQEWGTLVTGGNRQQDGYLRGILDTSWRSGANGFREYSNGCPEPSFNVVADATVAANR